MWGWGAEASRGWEADARASASIQPAGRPAVSRPPPTSTPRSGRLFASPTAGRTACWSSLTRMLPNTPAGFIACPLLDAAIGAVGEGRMAILQDAIKRGGASRPETFFSGHREFHQLVIRWQHCQQGATRARVVHVMRRSGIGMMKIADAKREAADVHISGHGQKLVR